MRFIGQLNGTNRTFCSLIKQLNGLLLCQIVGATILPRLLPLLLAHPIVVACTFRSSESSHRDTIVHARPPPKRCR
jgi:hypothetical protein